MYIGFKSNAHIRLIDIGFEYGVKSKVVLFLYFHRLYLSIFILPDLFLYFHRLYLSIFILPDTKTSEAFNNIRCGYLVIQKIYLSISNML